MKRLHILDDLIENKFHWTLRDYFNEEWCLLPKKSGVNGVIDDVTILSPVVNPGDFEYVQCAANLNLMPTEVILPRIQ